jgi:hypothetical protein
MCQNGRYDSRLGVCGLTGVLLLAAAAALAQVEAPERPAAADMPLTVGEITIHTDEIFTEAEVQDATAVLRALRRAMNGLHVDTRTSVIGRELLFASGDRFDPARLAETERNLRSLGILNNVRVAPVDTTADGRVNVAVTARESWTLQASFAYSLASGGDQRWNVQLAEENFLGYGVTLGGGVGADENAAYWNLWYRQRRPFGTGLWLVLDYARREDGFIKSIGLSRPFFAQGDPYGLEAKAWDNLANARFYLSNGGPAGFDPRAAASLYALLAQSYRGLEVNGQVRIGSQERDRLWRLGGGLRIQELAYPDDLRDQPLSDGRREDLTWLADPGQPYARDLGITVFPFVWLHSQGRRWTEGRFVLRYGAIEDVPLDLVLDLKTGPAGGRVGSTTAGSAERLRAEAELTKWWRLPGGFGLLQGMGAAEMGSTEVRNYRYAVLGGWFSRYGTADSPWLTRLVGEFGQGGNLNGAQALLLGLERGMRTLDFDGMAGDHLVRWNVEQGKVMPWELLGFFRTGFAAFYGGGCAWWADDEDRSLADARHEIGAGLRLGPTRSTSAQTVRIDLTWPLNESGGPYLTAITRGTF